MHTAHWEGDEKGRVLIIKLSNVNSGIRCYSHDDVIHTFIGRKKPKTKWDEQSFRPERTLLLT